MYITTNYMYKYMCIYIYIMCIHIIDTYIRTHHMDSAEAPAPPRRRPPPWGAPWPRPPRAAASAARPGPRPWCHGGNAGKCPKMMGLSWKIPSKWWKNPSKWWKMPSKWWKIDGLLRKIPWEWMIWGYSSPIWGNLHMEIRTENLGRWMKIPEILQKKLGRWWKLMEYLWRCPKAAEESMPILDGPVQCQYKLIVNRVANSC